MTAVASAVEQQHALAVVAEGMLVEVEEHYRMGREEIRVALKAVGMVDRMAYHKQVEDHDCQSACHEDPRDQLDLQLVMGCMAPQSYLLASILVVHRGG